MKNNTSHPPYSLGGICNGARLLLLALALSAVSCRTPPTTIAGSRPVTERVRLVPGDVVKLNFPGGPDFNQTQKIRADGKISLPVVGELEAAGKTVTQLQTELIRLYKPQLTNSDVLVTLEGGVTQVYLTGAVGRPGKMGFDRPTTILQAIMEAGGPTEFGSLKKVRIIRLENGQQRTHTINLSSTMAGATTPPAYVQDGDIISVPATSF